jgi:hypothetical protein
MGMSKAPEPVLKLIWAEGEDAEFARRLFRRIHERYILTPARYRVPVRQYTEDNGDTFVGFTTAGWDKIDLEAWKLGRVGFRRFVGTVARWDTERQRVVLGRPRTVA